MCVCIAEGCCVRHAFHFKTGRKTKKRSVSDLFWFDPICNHDNEGQNECAGEYAYFCGND